MTSPRESSDDGRHLASTLNNRGQRVDACCRSTGQLRHRSKGQQGQCYSDARDATDQRSHWLKLSARHIEIQRFDASVGPSESERTNSMDLWYQPLFALGWAHIVVMLPLRQFEWRRGDILVGNDVEQVLDAVEPGVLLVVGRYHPPW